MLTRAFRWLRTEAPFVLVVVLMLGAAGYLYIHPRHWRLGAGLMAVALLAGGLLRLVLPAPRVGLLAVRGRWRDALCYLALGGVILAVTIRLQ